MTVPPSSTYRVQLTPNFGFDDAAQITSYLAELGVSHLYCSPYLQAAKGSNHGYDVVDHSRVNEELGGAPGRQRMVEALKSAGLKQVVDIVPNHMAIGGKANRWWWDVLENGPSSTFAGYFDVDWNPREAKLRNRVLMAILGDHYGRVLEAGELKVVRTGATFVVKYHDHELPVAPPSLEPILSAAAQRFGSPDLEFLASSFSRLPKATESDEESVYERLRDKEVIKARLEDLLALEPQAARTLDEVIAELNQDFDALDALMERQNYRLAYWRTAIQELDYRRFFDVDTLVGLRNEEPEVFQQTHELILDWLEDGSVDGLRIDHPDGLRDPAGYLEKLAERAPGAWVVVEKILEPGESLPESWPVAGTTGYDFLNRVTGVLVDHQAEKAITEAYEELTGEPSDWPQMVLNRKHLVLREVLAADLIRLTELLTQSCERHRRYRDYTRYEMGQALREVLASLPVYRTYLRPGEQAGPEDIKYVEKAVEAASDRREDLDPELFGFIQRLLLMQIEPQFPDEDLPPEIELAMRFQQLSGPTMAKGVEDTCFYNYNRFVALNEVGGDPSKFGISVFDFHRACQESQQTWPTSMLASSTHDTKRSEDVRARLALLSEMPERWKVTVGVWMQHNNALRRPGGPVDRNIEYLLYQSLVGAWPVSSDRMVQYMVKASKEAKVHTSWIAPDAGYDEALRHFVTCVMADDHFVQGLEAFVQPLLGPGRVNSLSQTLLKLTCPGVPDIYQGAELWDLSLVDPDNRRPVDYEIRRKLLTELATLSAAEIMARMDEGLPKLFVIRCALDLRTRCPEAFGAESTYEPLEASGGKAAHVVAFHRTGKIATIVPRLVMGLTDGWAGTQAVLPDGNWTNLFTGEKASGAVLLADLLGDFPVALLERA